jgi:hypothetical protein
MWLRYKQNEEKRKAQKNSPRGQGLCCDLLPLLFSDHIDRDAVNGNYNVQSSVYRSNCKYLTKQQKQDRMACLGNYAWNRRKTTQGGRLLYYKLSNNKLCMRVFCSASSRVQGFQHGRSGGCVLFMVKGEKQRSSRAANGRDSFCVFLFSVSSIENQTHISRTSGTSQTNNLPRTVLLLQVTVPQPQLK